MSYKQFPVEIVTTFNTLMQDCMRIEREHGFGNQTPGEDIALMHSELSEALEEIREDQWATILEGPNQKPVGLPSELADVVIRLLGFCARHGIDIGNAVLEKMAYNETRPFKHGGKAL